MLYAKGTRVRFLVDNLGASERDDLGHVVEHCAMNGDTGVVAFKHPNKKLPHWFYVEIEVDGKKLYVGVTDIMVEPV